MLIYQGFPPKKLSSSQVVLVFTYWILECLLAPAPPCPLLGGWLDACLIYPRWTLLVVEPGLYPLFPGWTHHHQYSPNLPLASNCSLVWQGERAVPLFQSLDPGSLVYHFISGGLPTIQPCSAVCEILKTLKIFKILKILMQTALGRKENNLSAECAPEVQNDCSNQIIFFWLQTSGIGAKRLNCLQAHNNGWRPLARCSSELGVRVRARLRLEGQTSKKQLRWPRRC